jgi:hypothetical protein
MHDQDTYARAPTNDTGVRETTDTGSKVAVAAGTATQTAQDGARAVAGTARREAGSVVQEAGSQVRRLASQARDQATDRVRVQHDRAVYRLRGLAKEFEEMGGYGDSPGRALVSDLGHRGHRVADYLADRGPDGLASEVTDFARRRPLAFVAGAVAVGFLVGRLGKNVWKAKSTDTGQPELSTPRPVYRGAQYAEPVHAEPVYAEPMVADPYPAEPVGTEAPWTPPPVTGVAQVPPQAAPQTPVASPYASETYDAEQHRGDTR